MTLTREAILAMPAGPEMDALVAERVLGCKLAWQDHAAKPWLEAVGREVPKYPYCGCSEMAPHGGRAFGLEPFSGRVEAAWEVVETLRTAGRNSILNTGPKWEGYEIHVRAEDPRWSWAIFEYEGGLNACCAKGETTPLAICRAALLTTLEAE